MSAVLNDFLYSLSQFDSTKSIEQLIPQAKTINDLRIKFLEINCELYSIYLNGNQTEEAHLQLKSKLSEVLSKKITSTILDKIGDTPLEKAEFIQATNYFESISFRITIGILPRLNLGLWPFPSLLQSSLIGSRKINFDQTANHNPCSLTGEQLIQAVKELKTSDDVIEFAQTIDAEQIIEIASAKECDAHLPRMLTSLPHEIFSDFLHTIDDAKALAINRKLIRVRNETWFAEKFKQIRENIVNVSNNQATKIDNLNRELRKISLQDISKHTIARIEKLRNETCQAWEAQKRLQILIRNIIFDCETSHLFEHELPIRYLGLIHRLSDKEDEQKYVSGCPYGIIYRIAFDDYKDEINDPAELQNELLSIICTWIPNWRDWIQVGIIENPSNELLNEWKKNVSEAYLHGISNLKAVGIASLKDLKSKRIFNSDMLKEYLQSKKNNKD